MNFSSSFSFSLLTPPYFSFSFSHNFCLFLLLLKMEEVEASKKRCFFLYRHIIVFPFSHLLSNILLHLSISTPWSSSTIFFCIFLLSMGTLFYCGCTATPICPPSPKLPSPMSKLANQTLLLPLNSDFLHHCLQWVVTFFITTSPPH